MNGHHADYLRMEEDPDAERNPKVVAWRPFYEFAVKVPPTAIRALATIIYMLYTKPQTYRQHIDIEAKPAEKGAQKHT